MDEQIAKRLKSQISEIADKRKNTTLADIERAMTQVGKLFPVKERQATHGRLYSVGGQRFMVNYHNKGQKQVKTYSVDAFLEAMTELELYED